MSTLRPQDALCSLEEAATFRYDTEVEEVFASTTVRTREAVFQLFGGAGTKFGKKSKFEAR